MAAMSPRPYLMISKAQHYGWGTRGRDAYIPNLLGIEAEPNLPYAELWMGTHPNAPSDVVVDDTHISLADLISKYPVEMLGRETADRFSGTLPFLLKVLAVGGALSIQAHPNREQARWLHARDPEHYPDDNHKPEIAVALDRMTALAGFRPLPEIVECLERAPELAGLVGQEAVGAMREAQAAPDFEQRAALQVMILALMRPSVSEGDVVTQASARLARRLNKRREGLAEEEEVFLELRTGYPDDVGVFSPFLLNLVHLNAGQALFIGPGVPHVYLDGNAVECMARSDNVVRAGLTPKFKDVETLIEILTYDMGLPWILAEDPARTHVVYQTPAAEFELSRRTMRAGEIWRQEAGASPRIVLVTRGDAVVGWEAGSGREEQAVQRGQSLFVPASLEEYDLRSVGPVELFEVGVPGL